MSRISIIALLFPPIQQIGARRPLRLANYLARQGHDVTVYAVHPGAPGLGDYCGVDPATLAEIDPRVRVVRTPSFHGFKVVIRWRDCVRRWRARTAARVGQPPAAVSSTSTVRASEAENRRTTVDVATRIQGWFAIPDTFTGWVLTTLPVLLVRSVFRRPHAIFVTAPPWSPLILGIMAGKALKVPVHIDFRDPWTLNPYVQAAPLSIRLERWVVRNSASLFATTEAMAADFRRVYPASAGRILAVYNGYDEGTRARVEELLRSTPRTEGGPFVVCHLGTLYPARMPRRLADSLAHAAAAWDQPRPLRFRFLGRVWEPASLLGAFASAGVSDALELPGEVSTHQALKEAVKADALLLLQLGTSQQVPAKLFEYAFTGNPLVCVADEASETAGLIRKYRLGHVMTGSEHVDALRQHLEALSCGTVPHQHPGESFWTDFDGNRLAGLVGRMIFQQRP